MITHYTLQLDIDITNNVKTRDPIGSKNNHFITFFVKTPKHLLQMNLDDRDANGFWERFTVNSVHGKFQCEDSEGCGNVWKSVQIQVDLRVKLVLHS